MLNNSHLEKLMAESGINSNTASEAGLFSISTDKSKELIGFETEGIAFPYHNFKGDLIGYRVKQDNPQMNAKGKPAKYLTAKGSKASIFFPKSNIHKIINSKELVIVEGEKKLLKFQQVLAPKQIASVAIAGCWMFRQKLNENDELHPILEEALVDKESVTIIPDSDYFKNMDVRIAYNRLAKVISKRKINVSFVDLRTKDCNDKIGLDDFLLKFDITELNRRLASPYVTFKEILKLNFGDIIQQTTTNSEALLKISRSLAFLDEIEVEEATSCIHKSFEKVSKTTIKNTLLKSKEEFPVDFPKDNTVEWEASSETLLDAIHQLGNLMSETNGLFLDESCPKKLMVVSDDLQTTNKLITKDELADFVNNKYHFRRVLATKSGKKPLSFSSFPKELISTLHFDIMKYCPLLTIKHISDSPLLIQNELLNQKGFNQKYGVLIKNDYHLPSLSNTHINEFLDLIPFSTDADRDNFLACLISSLFLMFDLPGQFPALIINANGPGSGKTTLAKCLEYLVENRNNGTCSFKDDEELEKELATKTKESNIVIFDNIREHRISSPLLERCLTDETLNFRMFRTQTYISRKNTVQFIFTMNGGGLTPDLASRCIFIELEKDKLNITRKDSPLEYVKTHRANIINELILYLINYLNHGSPIYDYVPQNRFPRWTTLVNSILRINGHDQFLINHPSRTNILDEKVNLILNTVIAFYSGDLMELNCSMIKSQIENKRWSNDISLSPHAIGRALKSILNVPIKFFGYDNQNYLILITKQKHPAGGSNSTYRFKITPYEKNQMAVNSVLNPDVDCLNMDQASQQTDSGNESNTLHEIHDLSFQTHQKFNQPF